MFKIILYFHYNLFTNCMYSQINIQNVFLLYNKNQRIYFQKRITNNTNRQQNLIQTINKKSLQTEYPFSLILDKLQPQTQQHININFLQILLCPVNQANSIFMYDQSIQIPEQLHRHKDFTIKISTNNQKIYNHIQNLKTIVQSLYQMYRKISKSILKLTSQSLHKLSKHNDCTALAIINFIKGINTIYQNIEQQIGNNTVNMNKKNQKVSKTRKDIIHQKLNKINQLFKVYLSKVQKYNEKQSEYQKECYYHFKSIENDVIKFYSIKENKAVYQKLIKQELTMQESLEEIYSLKIQFKSGLCELRLSLKEFFQMLSNNAEDDKKLVLAVRKKLKQTKIFNETIIEQVNSQAQQSVKQSNNGGRYMHQQSYYLRSNHNSNNNNYANMNMFIKGENNDGDENNRNHNQRSLTVINPYFGDDYRSNSVGGYVEERVIEQFRGTFSSLNNDTTIQQDRKELMKNIELETLSINIFVEFLWQYQKLIYQTSQLLQKVRSSKQYQKLYNNKKFQISQILTNDIIINTQIIKNQISDFKQIIENIKPLLDKKKIIKELKNYREIKYQKFISESQYMLDGEKKIMEYDEVRVKYKEQKQKFAKSHLELMKRFRQTIQDMFKQINQKFKYQRQPSTILSDHQQYDNHKLSSHKGSSLNSSSINIKSPNKQICGIKKRNHNQFIKKKYYSILMLKFFINKQDPPKFQTNPFLKNYQKYLSDDQLRKVGLLQNAIAPNINAQNSQNNPNGHTMKKSSKKKGWGCCGILPSFSSALPKNKYIDQFNCALKKGIVLIQGKMKLHQNYLKFISSFNTKTLFGSSNIRIPKWDIQSVEKGQYLLSIKIIINTIKGPIQFTSFLTDPFQKLQEIYQSRGTTNYGGPSVMGTSKKLQPRSPTSKNLPILFLSQHEINSVRPPTPTNQNFTQTTQKHLQTHNLLKTTPLPSLITSRNYMVQLQQKFQFQIPQLLNKNLFTIQSLSTYLSQNKKQLLISIQYHLLSNKNKKYFFQIKLYDKNSTIQYRFVHEKTMEDQAIKEKLEKMALTIINSNNWSGEKVIGQKVIGFNNGSAIDNRLTPKNTNPPVLENGFGIRKTKSIQMQQMQINDQQYQKKATLQIRFGQNQIFSSKSRQNNQQLQQQFIQPDSNYKKKKSQKQKQQSKERLSFNSYSFIERKQNNQFQFDNDPSFVYFKQPSIANNNGGDPSFNYIPDLQIFKNMESQKKIVTFDKWNKMKDGDGYRENDANFNKRSEKSLTMKMSRNITTNKQIGDYTSSLSRKQIEEYLDSIDEKDVKKKLFAGDNNSKRDNKRSMKNSKKDSQRTTSGGNATSSYTKSIQITSKGINLNFIVLILIIAISINLLTSIFK